MSAVAAPGESLLDLMPSVYGEAMQWLIDRRFLPSWADLTAGHRGMRYDMGVPGSYPGLGNMKAAWLNDLEACMDECPVGLFLYMTGDRVRLNVGPVYNRQQWSRTLNTIKGWLMAKYPHLLTNMLVGGMDLRFDFTLRGALCREAGREFVANPWGNTDPRVHGFYTNRGNLQNQYPMMTFAPLLTEVRRDARHCLLCRSH